jgi:hypothetical protein
MAGLPELKEDVNMGGVDSLDPEVGEGPVKTVPEVKATGVPQAQSGKKGKKKGKK